MWRQTRRPPLSGVRCEGPSRNYIFCWALPASVLRIEQLFSCPTGPHRLGKSENRFFPSVNFCQLSEWCRAKTVSQPGPGWEETHTEIKTDSQILLFHRTEHLVTSERRSSCQASSWRNIPILRWTCLRTTDNTRAQTFTQLKAIIPHGFKRNLRKMSTWPCNYFDSSLATMFSTRLRRRVASPGGQCGHTSHLTPHTLPHSHHDWLVSFQLHTKLWSVR